MPLWFHIYDGKWKDHFCGRTASSVARCCPPVVETVVEAWTFCLHLSNKCRFKKKYLDSVFLLRRENIAGKKIGSFHAERVSSFVFHRYSYNKMVKYGKKLACNHSPYRKQWSWFVLQYGKQLNLHFRYISNAFALCSGLASLGLWDITLSVCFILWQFDLWAFSNITVTLLIQFSNSYHVIVKVIHLSTLLFLLYLCKTICSSWGLLTFANWNIIMQTKPPADETWQEAQ